MNEFKKGNCFSKCFRRPEYNDTCNFVKQHVMYDCFPSINMGCNFSHINIKLRVSMI